MTEKTKTWQRTLLELVIALLLHSFVLMLVLGVLRDGLHPAIPAPGYGTTLALIVALNLLVPGWRRRK